MNKEEFIDLCKRMVVEYYNRYVYHVKELTVDDINVVEYFVISGDKQRALLSAGILWGKKCYEVIYDNTTKKLYTKAFEG